MVNNRKASKSTIAVILLSLLLCLSLILTATGAWFTDNKTGGTASDPVEFGKIAIVLHDEDYSVTAKTADLADVMPGDTITASFQVDNTYEAAYLRITMTVAGTAASGKTLDSEAILAFSNPSTNLTAAGTDGVYYAEVAAEAEGNEYSLNVVIDGDTFGNGWQGATVAFTLKVEAIQKANFDSAAEAFAEYTDSGLCA